MFGEETNMFKHSDDFYEFGRKDRKAFVMFKDKPVAELIEHKCPDVSNIRWSLRPYYDSIEYCTLVYGGTIEFPGVCLELHCFEYNLGSNPILIQRRLQQYTGEDRYAMLKRLRMDSMDVFEFLCRSHGVCDFDLFYISRSPDKVIDVYLPLSSYDIPF